MGKVIVKKGGVYREKKGGGALLRIRDAAAKKPKAQPAVKPALADRAAKDPALLARTLADPGLRRQLRDNQLTPELLKSRRDTDFKRDIADPTKPMQGETLVRSAEQLVDREYAPLLDDIGRQERRVGASRDAQQTWAKGNYDALGGMFKAKADEQVAAGGKSVDAAKQARMDQLAVVDEVQRQAAARAQADAGVRGEGLDGGANAGLADQMAAAKVRAGAEGTSREQDASSRATTQADFIKNLGSATAMRGAETQGQIATVAGNDLSELQGDRRKLRTDRNGKLTETMLKMRGDEVERYLTERGLATDMEKANLDAKTELAKIQSTDELKRWTVNRQAALRREGYDSAEAIAQANREAADTRSALDRASREGSAGYKGEGGGKDKPRFSKADRRRSAGDRDKAIGRAKAAREGGLSRADALTALGRDYPPEIARVAVNALYDGKVNSSNAAALKKRFGIDIPSRYR